MNRQRVFKVAAIIAAIWLLYSFISGNNRDESELLFTVESKPFEISIVETGVLESLNSVTLASSLPSNKGKILSLVPEGQYVEKGDVLVAFDHTLFNDDINKYKNEIREGKALVSQTREDLKLQIAMGREEISTAELNIKLARMELANVTDGDGPLRVREAEKEMQETASDWKQADNEYKDLSEMLQEGFITRLELEKSHIQLERTKNRHELAKEKYKMLRDLGHPAEKEKANLELKKREEELVKLKETNVYREMRSEVIVERAKNKLNTAEENLDKVKEYLKETKIVSPSPGFVIYKDVPVMGESRKVHVGDSVWQNQGFIVLPDVSKMAVNIRIREVDINKVSKGQDVLISVDSYPDLILHGKVDMVGMLAKEDKDNSSGAKYFNLQISVNEFDNRLRPGMTARATIIVKQFEDVLKIPVEAVFQRDGENISFISEGGSAEIRELELGDSDEDFVIVLKGIKQGEKVYLKVPQEYQ
ncbi:efflux RND transporter periplasmic adaptor subunit [bacterium]|nr:efflux RND transporter periplasmic adaptor subunit [bacterium]